MLVGANTSVGKGKVTRRRSSPVIAHLSEKRLCSRRTCAQSNESAHVVRQCGLLQSIYICLCTLTHYFSLVQFHCSRLQGVAGRSRCCELRICPSLMTVLIPRMALANPEGKMGEELRQPDGVKSNAPAPHNPNHMHSTLRHTHSTTGRSRRARRRVYIQHPSLHPPRVGLVRCCCGRVWRWFVFGCLASHMCVWYLAGRCAEGHAGRPGGVRLWAPPLIQTGSGWPFSVLQCAARPASVETDS